MDRDELEEWLCQGLSLRQIARLVDRDPSTVRYWMDRHGLVANGRAKHAARGGLRREELESLIEEGATMRPADKERCGASASR
jgi:IS30 family transposase